MRKISSVLLLALLVISTFLIAGCLPPNYSKDKAKEIATEHGKDVVTWFQKNMPDAQVDKDVKAATEAQNLLAAVQGTYKHHGKSYNYVYAYKENKMYVEEGYEATCNIIKQRILKEAGLTEQETKVSFHGYNVYADNANDKAKQNGNDEATAKRLSLRAQKLKPAKLTPQEFADAVLAPNTQERFNFYLRVYQEAYPEQSPAVLAKYKNLGAVFYNTPVAVTQEQSSISQKIYNRKEVKANYCRFVKINDYLYGGYTTSGVKPTEDKLKLTKQDDKSFTLEVPANSKVTFFSTKAVKLVHYFKNANGEVIKNEAKELVKSDVPSFQNCHEYDGKLVVEDKVAHGYSSLSVPRVKGVYQYKIAD